MPRLQPLERVAVDTEADSLHCYFEKLCLVQMSFDGQDYLVDPLASFDLTPLATALEGKEIVLQGADYDLRLMKRAFNFTASKVFDTVVAARLLGLREFSLAALVQRYFEVTLSKGSQKANWAQRPLPPQMAEYAMNDTRYLLPLAWVHGGSGTGDAASGIGVAAAPAPRRSAADAGDGAGGGEFAPSAGHGGAGTRARFFFHRAADHGGLDRGRSRAERGFARAWQRQLLEL